MDEALAVLEETMRRFPQNEVTPNAYAEALRSAGRMDEALAVLEETMRRFPHSAVACNACAHLLAEFGRIEEAEALLKPAAQRAQLRNDWIAIHVLAMIYLRTKRVDDALRELERGVEDCKFTDVYPYFVTARPLALIAARRAEEAVRQLELLARDQSRPQEETTNIALFRIHALAEIGQTSVAQNIMGSAQIIDLALAKQKRLAIALEERYGIMSGLPAPPSKVGELDDNIIKLEFELVQPALLMSKVA
jgi:tetratricopeptide (TPR) repeat protein